MSPTVARATSFRGIAATIALALIAALGISVASTPPASADTTEPFVTFTWISAELTSDGGTIGVPDDGDEVTLTYEVRLAARATRTLDDFNLTIGSVVVKGRDQALAPGEARTYTAALRVDPSLLDSLGGGPHWVYTHFVFGGAFGVGTVSIPVPPVAYTAPAPITVSTSLEMTEIAGSVPGQLVEGDSVHYATHVTNTSSVPVQVSGTGYASPTLPMWLEPGTSVDLVGPSVDVTYAHMAAGGVSLADASLDWWVDGVYFGPMSGTVPAAVSTAPTEAIDDSVTYGVATSVNDSTGAPVALGDAVAGDRVDYTFQLANTGNVVIDYAAFERDLWPGVSGYVGRGHLNSDLTQGAALPAGVWPATWITSDGGGWSAYPLSQTDVDRGYVDLMFVVSAAPSEAVYTSNTAKYRHVVRPRVLLREFSTATRLAFTTAELHDTNGDGIGQEGETVTYRVQFTSDADQLLRIDSAYDAPGSDIATPVASAFSGKTLAEGETIDTEWVHTITAADEARGTILVGVTSAYMGRTSLVDDSRTAWAPSIDTGAYVAPPTTLETSGTYEDANADGFPSIGEKVTVTVTAANIGTYPLTGLVVTDAAGSDPVGLLPRFSGTMPAGTSETQTFTHVLTAGDFARGSLYYSTEMTADGMSTTASSASVHFTDISFQAYESDLLAKAEGGVSVCLPTQTPTDTVVIGTSITVTPGGSCIFGGLPDGYRVVAFSAPLVLGTDAFSVSVPSVVGVGAHRLALYGPGGELVGWQAVTVKQPIALSTREHTGLLASTGLNEGALTALAGGAAALLLLGAVSMVVGLRPRRRGVTSARGVAG